MVSPDPYSYNGPPVPPPPPLGTKSSAKHVLSAALHYAQARGKLLAVEARIAAAEMKMGLILFGAAAIALLLGGAILLVGIVLLVMMVLPQANGAAACGAVGALFIIAAWLMLRGGRKALSGQNFFPVTRAEFHEDHQCLKNQ